ncbi:MAG: hypothetical protein AB7E47_01685 [Desulfovibrionaceae bacterium]
MDVQKDFDILEFPFVGVAAYWLSIKKLVGAKRNVKALEEEAAYTSEPYIKYLLELCFSDLDDQRVRMLMAVRRDVQLDTIRRKFDLMRMALVDVADSENPRKTLAKMSAQFTVQELTEEKAFAYAQDLAKVASGKSNNHAAFFNVDHRLKPDKLMVTLLFYVMWARREGKLALQPFLRHIRSEYFAEGLSLVADGFEAPFVRKRMRVQRDVILDEARLKMDMSAELCMGIRHRLTYEDLFRMTKAYLA